MKFLEKFSALFILLVLISFSESKLWANLADSFGYGAHGIGMSGARVSNVNDWSSPYYNMAGLTAPLIGKKFVVKEQLTSSIGTADAPIKRTKKQATFLELGFNYLFQASSMDIETKSQNARVKENVAIAKDGLNYGIIQFGLNMDLRRLIATPLNLPLKFGLAMAIRDNGTIATVNDTSAESYNFLRLGREAQRLVIISGISMQAWKNRISIGVGASMFTGGKGYFRMSKVAISPGVEQIPEQEIKMDLTPAIAPTMGVMYRQPIKRKNLMLGLSYRGELYMEMDPLTAVATTDMLSVDLPLTMAILDFYTPHTAVFGASFYVNTAIIALLDIEYQHWSGFRLSSAKVKYYKDQDISIPKFKNIFMPKLAGEFRPGKYIKPLRKLPLWTRAGYAYQPAFTPDQKGTTNFLDNSKHILSLGASYTLPKNIVLKVPTILNFGIQWQIWANRDSKKSGSSSYNPDYTYGGDVFITSLSAAWKF